MSVKYTSSDNAEFNALYLSDHSLCIGKPARNNATVILFMSTGSVTWESMATTRIRRSYDVDGTLISQITFQLA